MVSIQKPLKLKTGIRTALLDGTLVYDSPKHMCTEGFYRAYKGDVLRIEGKTYLYAIAVYSLQRDEAWMYTYDYQREENWTTYTQNLTPESYTDKMMTFAEDCYFRVCVKRADGECVEEKDIVEAEGALKFDTRQVNYQKKPYFEEEIGRFVNHYIQRTKNQHPGAFRFCLLADTHYVVNGTWEDTAHNIQEVCRQIPVDAIVHLGDLTDGLMSKDIIRQYASHIIEDLKKINTPLYLVRGNHDTNYFRGNAQALSIEEQEELYGTPDYYCKDFVQARIRAIFLAAFDDNNPVRYGYSEEEIRFVEKTLASTPKDFDILVFSHDAPLAELDYWSFYIRNGEKLLQILEDYNEQSQHHVLGFFYGHTHADFVYNQCSFPLISIGCNKCEYYADRKPKGAKAPMRKPDTVTQDLWDAVRINPEHTQIDMYRFGAGDDRSIDCSKKPSFWQEDKKRRRKARTTKIWAHRGASGYAPENTLPAFELAHRLGADGVELDVQLTRDGELVVVHDERIDRVSDGKGYVRDYTLKELRQFDFNKVFPAYGKVFIPTLREVYELLKPTDLLINVELKNSIYFYPELEEKVLQLAMDMKMEKRIWYSSFNHYSMCRIKELNPKAKVGFLYTDGILSMAEYAQKNGAEAIHPSFNNLKYPNLISQCKERNIQIHVWTVNDEADIAKAIELGVEALITNFPDRAALE